MSHPWLPHLPFTMSTSSSSPMYPTHTENTQYIPLISKLLQSTSCALKHHPDVKTCRVAETRAPQLPQVMSPKNLRLSQGSKLILEIHVNCTKYKKKLEKKIYELLSPKKWRNVERLGQLACRIPKYQRRPTSNRRCIQTIPWRALQNLISKMESYKKCWLHHCMPRKLWRDPMQWSCRRER